MGSLEYLGDGVGAGEIGVELLGKFLGYLVDVVYLVELLLSPVFVNIFGTYFAVVAVGVYDPFFEEGLPLECFDDIGLQVLIFSYLAGLLYLFFGSFVVCVGNDFFVVVDAFLWYWGEQYKSGEGTEAREGYVGLS